jgi:hypothetical protein
MGMFLNLALETERGAAEEKTSSETSRAVSVEREAEAVIESSTSNLVHLSEEHRPLDPYEVEADARTIARRRRVLSMLEKSPRLRYALVSDTEAEGDDVILTLAIRELGTCELAIPKAKYDALKVLRMIEETRQQGG